MTKHRLPAGARPSPRHTLGMFELLLLLGIGRVKRGGITGTKLQGMLIERTQAPVTVGHVYASLHRLAEKGLVRSEQQEARAVRGGRARMTYHVTDYGKQVASGTIRMINAMVGE